MSQRGLELKLCSHLPQRQFHCSSTQFGPSRLFVLWVVSYLKMQSFDHITFFKQLQTFKKALLIIKMHHNQVSSSIPPHSPFPPLKASLSPIIATKMRKKSCLQIFYAEKKQQMLLTNFLFGLCPSAFRRDATKCSMLLFRAIPSFINKR